MILATRGVVASGHYLSTEIGLEVLRRGGNAMDAAVAVGFGLAVLQPHQNGIGGEVSVLVYSADERKVHALSGGGVAPAGATIDHFRSLGVDLIPGDGFLPALVPPAVGTWILLLERFGTMRLADVLSPAVGLARDGLPMYDVLHDRIKGSAERFRSEWPTSAATFLPGGVPPDVGSVWQQPNWAETFGRLLKGEGRHKNRAAGLRAACDVFYRGVIAERIVAFASSTAVRDASGKSHKGLLTVEDFAEFEARCEDALSTSYRGLTVHKCDTWTQGAVLLQALNLLEGYDLSAMGHNSAESIHTIVECMKLAYADREFYYGDPEFTDVPIERLLSKEYAEKRRGLVDGQRASLELRAGGYPPIQPEGIDGVNRVFDPKAFTGDTTKLEVIDGAGNMVSATPSGGWLASSPVIEGLGFPLGTRGQMFSLAQGHPNSLEPGKRPRTTLTPSIATADGRGVLAFGSPGGDAQDQWALQFLIAVVDYGLSLQEAVEAPTFWSGHFPGSFYPRAASPGELIVEGRIQRRVREELAGRGHRVTDAEDWSGGNTLAAAIDHGTGVRSAAASPRLNPAYAGGF